MQRSVAKQSVGRVFSNQGRENSNDLYINVHIYK